MKIKVFYEPGSSTLMELICDAPFIACTAIEQGKKLLKKILQYGLCTIFTIPHKLTLYAVKCVLQFIKDTVGGAGNCVGLCGNLPHPGLCFISNLSTSKSYHK
jgi:hypothetical protein